MFNNPAVDALTILFIIVPVTVIAIALIKVVSDQICRWSDQRHERRMAEARHRAQEVADLSKERQLKEIPKIIEVYRGVTGDTQKTEELSVLLRGLICGNAQSSDPVLHEKLDEIRERLEALERDEDDDQGDEDEEEEGEEQEEDHESDESWFSLQLNIEKEKTARVEALFSHLQATHTHPSPAQLEGLILAAQGQEPEPPVSARDSGVRVDPGAAAPMADLVQASDEAVAANAANDDAQRDGPSSG